MEVGLDGVSVSVLVLVPEPAGWESLPVVDVEEELQRRVLASFHPNPEQRMLRTCWSPSSSSPQQDQPPAR